MSVANETEKDPLIGMLIVSNPEGQSADWNIYNKNTVKYTKMCN